MAVSEIDRDNQITDPDVSLNMSIALPFTFLVSLTLMSCINTQKESNSHNGSAKEGIGYSNDIASSYDMSEVGRMPNKTKVINRNGVEVDRSLPSSISELKTEDITPQMLKALEESM